MAEVFVFGSNLAGRHGKGAAKYAVENYGARLGQGSGRQGRSYAIPTKDWSLKTLPLEDIKLSCETFLIYARMRYWDTFLLTPIGCGLAGYTREQIRPFFEGAPENVVFLKEWND